MSKNSLLPLGILFLSIIIISVSVIYYVKVKPITETTTTATTTTTSSTTTSTITTTTTYLTTSSLTTTTSTIPETVSCYSNNDCDDNNINSNDYCIKAGTTDSRCANIPKTYCENGICNYKMAFIIVTKEGARSITSEYIDKVNLIKGNFTKMFSRSTFNKINIDTSDDVYTFTLSNPEDYFVTNVIKQFYSMYPDNFDFITIFDTWHPKGTIEGVHHTYHTEITTTGSFYRDNITKRLKSIQVIGDIYGGTIANVGSDEGTYGIAHLVAHETGHLWNAYLGENVGIIIGPHYSVNLKENDIMGCFGCDWVKINNTYYKIDLKLSEKLERGLFNEISLFAMGVIGRNEVNPVTSMTDIYSCMITPSAITLCANNTQTITIDQIAPKGDFSVGRDIDTDGIPDWMELQGETGYRTDFLNRDSDGDGVNDYQEIQKGTNPLDPNNNFVKAYIHP